MQVNFDVKEKYPLSPVEARIAVLDKERKGNNHENEIQVEVIGWRAMPIGDVSISEKNDAKEKNNSEESEEKGRFEVKRHNDLKGCLADLRAFMSQLEGLAELGKAKKLEVIGLILLYDDKDFTKTEQRKLMTITAKYQIRERGEVPFVIQRATSELENLGDIVYRLCENIARRDCSIRADHDKLEGHNLREKRVHSETAQHHLELDLRNIPGLGHVAAYAIAKDFQTLPEFLAVLSNEGPAFRLRYPAAKLGRKTGLGQKIAEVVTHRLGYGKKFNISDESCAAKEKKKPVITGPLYSSASSMSIANSKPHFGKAYQGKYRYNPYAKKQQEAKKAASCTDGFASGGESE
jgi:hypothetical protein